MTIQLFSYYGSEDAAVPFPYGRDRGLVHEAIALRNKNSTDSQIVFQIQYNLNQTKRIFADSDSDQIERDWQ